MKVTSIVLAGGKSLRLGRRKVLELIGDTSLIGCVIKRLRPVSDQILIVTSREQLDFPDAAEAEILVDLYPDKGPLAGIYTGLTAARSPQSIVVGSDMPFLNAELLGYMVGLAGDFDAVVPRLDKGMMEPLHAVYSRSCLDVMKTRLENNQLSVHQFVNSIRVRYVEQDECQRLDPQLLSFFNINYQSDLDKALALARQGK